MSGGLHVQLVLRVPQTGAGRWTCSTLASCRRGGTLATTESGQPEAPTPRY